MMSNFNFERAIDRVVDSIAYEITEQIEYMIQDAFGVPSFYDLSDDQIAELIEKTQELEGNYVVNEIRYLIGLRDYCENPDDL